MSICQLCKWFEIIDGEEEKGYCKKNAPIADANGIGRWPVVLKNEKKCGAFEFNRRLLPSNINKKA